MTKSDIEKIIYVGINIGKYWNKKYGIERER